jgi:hypothetical protein
MLGLLLVGLIVVVVCLERLNARQVLLPSPDSTRFQLIGNEPVVGPDGRAVVTGWSVLVLKDRRDNRCHLAFNFEKSIAMGGTIACPQ